MSAGVRNALGLGLIRGGAATTQQQVRGYCQLQAAASQHPATNSELCSFVGGALSAFVVLWWWLKPVEERFKRDLKESEELVAASMARAGMKGH